MNDFYGHVPFEPREAARGCGAACLAMTYRALGRPVPQADVWPRIAKRNGFGSLASTTHLMARDAIDRGFAAVAVQAAAPLQALRATCDANAHAILNLRLAPDEPAGHYALLLDVDVAKAAFHDPDAGPRRMLDHAALLGLWAPDGGASEPSGHVLIAVAHPTEGDAACAVCRAPIPASLACPRCAADVALRPSAPLGCMAAGCGGRLWERLCCPGCDLLWSPGEAAARPAAAPAISGADLDRLVAAVEAFVVATLASPGARGRPELVGLAGHLAGARELVSGAMAADAAGREALTAMHAKAAAEAAARVAAIRARTPKPPPAAAADAEEEPPLDADALGRALLERLAA